MSLIVIVLLALVGLFLICCAIAPLFYGSVPRDVVCPGYMDEDAIDATRDIVDGTENPTTFD